MRGKRQWLITLLPILLSAVALRLFGINWDQGIHLHPDERMLIMVAERLHFFDKLNPEFFNYGSLPIYLLRGLAQILDAVFGLHIGNYDGMLYLGRLLSTIADLGTLYFIYLIARKLFKDERVALISAFFYAIAFFPIQNSHFFIVDTFLTLSLTALVYASLLYFEKPTALKVLLIALITASAMTTKFTAVIFLPLVVLLIVYKNFKDFSQLFRHIFVLSSSFLAFSFLFMPYAYLDWQKFLSDVMLQINLNSDAYTFPYTLQYVDTFPYFYYLENIFLWGLGPVVSLLSLTGLYFTLKVRERKENLIVFFFFYLLYFLIIGRSAVKFMRYMLPMYPFLTLMAGYGLWRISQLRFTRFLAPLRVTVSAFGITLAAIWTLMFMNLYFHEHPRITATNWIQQNVPPGSTLAVEHWDDNLPLRGGENYNFVELTLYDQPDGALKWIGIEDKLSRADYIILSSNRLYVPLQKLNDCNKYKSCYPRTAEYYKNLFSGKLGFEKVAEFAVYPGLKIGNWGFEIPDDTADESFTVYDHPKVIIFKRQ